MSQIFFEIMAFFIVFSGLLLGVGGISHLTSPLCSLDASSISLDPSNLPLYAFYTTLRMMVAVFLSLLFTFIYANSAAKNQKLGQILIPLLDILQSIPVLGYIAFTVSGFLLLFPKSMLGPELAVIFAIFTSQAWNMTFSLYQSLRTTPKELSEAAFVFNLSPWKKFWKLELPFAMPSLIWNTMMSMSSGWFFVVASEAITVGHEKIFLPGIGSYIALAIQKKDLCAVGFAIGSMLIVIFLYDQFLFRPLVAWADKFRYEATMSQTSPQSWVLLVLQRSRFIQKFFSLLPALKGVRFSVKQLSVPSSSGGLHEKFISILWFSFLGIVGIGAFFYVVHFLYWEIGLGEFLKVLKLGIFTFLRVIVLVALASFLWVPIGLYIGLRPAWVQVIQPVAQFLASFPANLLFPVAVILVSHYSLNPNIWLSPLIIFGAQWYILFNVIAGASVVPNDLQEVSLSLKISDWNRWRRLLLPGIFPYFLTGAITATGGAWNASIVAEFVSWGSQSYEAEGLGSYIAQMTQQGNFQHIILGIGMMAFIVVVCNRFFWRPLYERAVLNFNFDG